MVKRYKIVALAVCAASLFAFPAQSNAAYGDYGYCGSLVSPDAWCPSSITVQNIYNKAMYVGSGQVRVGIRQILSGGAIYNRKFATNVVATNSQTYWSNAQVANASSNRHTIYGYAQYCDGSCPTPSSSRSVGRLLNSSKLSKGLAKAATATRYSDGSSISTRTGNGKQCLGRKSGTSFTESCNSTSGDAKLIITEDSVLGVPTGQTLVYGVAPKGAASVRVSVGRNPSTATKVENGVFSVTVKGTADLEPRVVAD